MLKWEVGAVVSISCLSTYMIWYGLTHEMPELITPCTGASLLEVVSSLQQLPATQPRPRSTDTGLPTSSPMEAGNYFYLSD